MNSWVFFVFGLRVFCFREDVSRAPGVGFCRCLFAANIYVCPVAMYHIFGAAQGEFLGQSVFLNLNKEATSLPRGIRKDGGTLIGTD